MRTSQPMQLDVRKERRPCLCSWPLWEFGVSEVAGTARCMIAGIVTELQVLAETRRGNKDSVPIIRDEKSSLQDSKVSSSSISSTYRASQHC
jgi:hypothetical protein